MDVVGVAMAQLGPCAGSESQGVAVGHLGGVQPAGRVLAVIGEGLTRRSTQQL